MRKIGYLNDRQDTKRFIYYLRSKGIPSKYERDKDHRFEIWIEEEDDRPRAERYLKQFVATPHDKEFSIRTQSHVRKIREVMHGRLRNKDRTKYINARTELFDRASQTFGTVTVTLIVLCSIATLATNVEGLSWLVRKLYFSEYFGRGFVEISRGELWRLITPILIHGGFIHLLFNMIWLYQLGNMIELKEGSFYLMLMVLITALICNSAQYIVSGPLFVGMSGVVYGLLGYCWMMTRFDLKKGYALSSQIVGFMIVWMVICIIGIIPNIANTQHVMGFIVGTLWGFLRSKGWKEIYRRRRFRNKF